MAQISVASGAKVSRSVRVNAQMWAAASAKAQKAGTNLNQVVGDLIEGYARGAIDLKIVKQFAQPAPQQEKKGTE